MSLWGCQLDRDFFNCAAVVYSFPHRMALWGACIVLFTVMTGFLVRLTNPGK